VGDRTRVAAAAQAAPAVDGYERERRIVDVIRSLRDGEVVSYGDIADVAGYPKQSRLVGRILSLSTDRYDLPWWRVVNAQGRLVPGHEREQAELLRAEGVTITTSETATHVCQAPLGRFRP
jgi:methylated-DNA-protein-cysteine methyltransferase related protein